MNKLFLTAIVAFLTLTCNSPNESTARSGSDASGGGSGDWLISENEIYDGGPGKDGIPALTEPDMTTGLSASYLTDRDLVIGVRVGESYKAYPHVILDWHEIINDEIGGRSLAITYCPLTGSGIGWNRRIRGTVTTFGVSGLLYNSNLIPYDRATDSNWSQMKLQAVEGTLSGARVNTCPVIETEWGTWKQMAPQTQVVSENTGYDRAYGRYPYGDYKTNQSKLLFPVSHTDQRLPGKTRVLGVTVSGESKAYPINSFGDLDVLNDMIGGQPVVIVGSSTHNFAVAYERRVNGEVLEFEPAADKALPVVMTDGSGSTWSVFGQAVDGDHADELLTSTDSYVAYWFAWAAFYPDTKL
ncbi:MAG: DUF3179 domain-containing protein [candidate division KSB1 bacterium]|nr:DUF3179 domain-containing protein [candidate division KSB1 bacterium]